MVIEWGIGTAAFEIAFDFCLHCLVQGHKATFAKLGAPYHQTVGRNILIPQLYCFGHAQSRARQQSKQRAVSLSAQGMVTRLSCRLHQTLDVFPGKNVRDSPRTAFAAKNGRRQFMGWILGTDIPAESNHFPKSVGTLMDRSQSRPLNCHIRANVVFSFCIGERGKTSQKDALGFKLDPAGTAHSQIGLHSLS
jgi:hypothetical protein